MTSQVGLHGDTIAHLLGEDGVDRLGTTVGRGQGPAGRGLVGVSHVVHGTDSLGSDHTRVYLKIGEVEKGGDLQASYSKKHFIY